MLVLSPAKFFLFIACIALLTTDLSAGERFVAVGYGGRRMVSDDGQTWRITAEWQEAGKDDSNNLMSLVHADGQFVATGGGGGGKTAGGHVLVSPDGENWTETWEAPNRINPVVFGNDRFVAGGPRRQLYWSTDAKSWNKGATLDDKRCTHFRQGAFGNGVFVITGNHGGQSAAWITSTKDGESVGEIMFDVPNIRGLAFGSGTFVVVGKGVRIASIDGRDWQSTGLEGDEPLTWVVHDGDRFLCGGGKTTYASRDGRDWSPTDIRPRGNVKWAEGDRLISSGWPGKMFYSGDGGRTWKQGNKLTANGINRVVRADFPTND